jgi:hypothetical protein
LIHTFLQVYITTAMPNQRAKNKALVGAFVDIRIKNRILQLAQSRNNTVSEIIGEALQQYLIRQGMPYAQPKHDGQNSMGQAEEDEELWRL